MENLKIYFYGVGGVSMSALARLCANFGAKVYGSDDNIDTNFEELRKNGIDCGNGINFAKIDDCDIFVYTIAVGENSEVVEYARKKGKKVLERAVFLGEIASFFKFSIAVAGMHGKTTTTAMLGNIFLKANKNPTIHLGGDSLDFGGNIYLGGKEYFITEACEFNKSLLNLRPHSCIITNIEREHMDTYKDLDEIYATFSTFTQQCEKFVVVNGDSIEVEKLKTNAKLVKFGLDDSNDFVAKNITQNEGKFEYDVCYKNRKIMHIKLNVMGMHNVLNSLACVALAKCYGVKNSDIATKICGYMGVNRRLTLLKLQNDINIYHDYAHHPTEVKATLDTLKLLKKKRIIAVFQPHTYTRTKALMSEFVQCFDMADFLYILPTYPAREKYLFGGDAQDLFYNLNGRINCEYCTNFVSLEYELNKQLAPNDILVFLGAGDIEKIAKMYVKTMKIERK